MFFEQGNSIAISENPHGLGFHRGGGNFGGRHVHINLAERVVFHISLPVAIRKAKGKFFGSASTWDDSDPDFHQTHIGFCSGLDPIGMHG